MKKTIAIGLSPNAQSDDILQSVKNIFSFFSYKKGNSVASLEQWFKNYFNVDGSMSFSNARSGLYAICKGLGIGKGDEVIIQAFTCIVVATPLLATGATVVYADVSKNLTFNIKDLENKITKKTKAIVVQHTFGIPADMEKITKLAKAYGVFLIEDVAHSIGATYKGKKLGTFGIASIFSFGRDKAFSSVFGGIVLSRDKELTQKIHAFQKQKPMPSFFWIFQQLLHPIAFTVILPLYDRASLGKVLLVLLQKLKLLSVPVESEEKRGKFDPAKIKRYPNALASLAINQLKKIESYNHKRKIIANMYLETIQELGIESPAQKDEILIRFPLFIEKPSALREYFRKENIYLGNWYHNVIDPVDSNFSAVGYTRGSCKMAEILARKIINLPTYPAMEEEDVRRVIQILKNYVAS